MINSTINHDLSFLLISACHNDVHGKVHVYMRLIAGKYKVFRHVACVCISVRTKCELIFF